jgi:hypothetical protein
VEGMVSINLILDDIGELLSNMNVSGSIFIEKILKDFSYINACNTNPSIVAPSYLTEA